MCCSVALRLPVKAADDATWRTYAAQAGIYDDLYTGRQKDYAAESARLIELIRATVPDAVSLLDVGCGTGRHLAYLRTEFGDVEGVEPSDGMRDIAARRLPGTPLRDGDMRTLDTGRRYDAVICMFAAIGYVGGTTGDTSGLFASIDRMAAHLNPGGVLIVEPWIAPERFVVGHVGSDFTRTAERSIFRMSHSGLVGADRRVCELTFRYVVGSPTGIVTFTGVDHLTMFSRAEFTDAFAAAGLRSTFGEPEFGRGLYVAS
jgi:dTDP-3-amino-3,4,6-trideoxy-alpha-D-glucopyranose N,N-dimethyltransferase